MLHHVPFYGVPTSDFFRLSEQHQPVRMVGGHSMFVIEAEISRNFPGIMFCFWQAWTSVMTHHLTDNAIAI